MSLVPMKHLHTYKAKGREYTYYRHGNDPGKAAGSPWIRCVSGRLPEGTRAIRGWPRSSRRSEKAFRIKAWAP